jgi:hypothetical protein
MLFGEFIRTTFLKDHQTTYKVLKEIQAPTIIRWNERKAILRWKNTRRQPVAGFNKFRNIELPSSILIDQNIPKKQGLWKILTASGSWIYFKRGRFGFYFDDKAI